MTLRKTIATLILLTLLATLAFIAGPLRWEFAHSYGHWIDSTGGALPTLTAVLGLPMLDLGPTTAGSIMIRLLIWGIAWLGPLALLIGVWTARRQGHVDLWLVYGGGLYATVMVLIVTLTATALWLPFALL